MPSFFFWAWPLTLILLISFGFAFLGWFNQGYSPKIRLAKLVSCSVFTGLILLFGSLYSSKSNWFLHPYAGIGGAIVAWLLLGQCAVSLLLVIRASKGTRFLSACILAFELEASLSAAFLASMSLSSTWL